MIKILTIVLLSTLARAHDCGDRLRDSNYRAVVRQVQRLNPAILAEANPSAEELYLALKAESAKYAHAVVDENLARSLRDAQAKHYAIEDLDVRGLTTFYRNALRALEQRAAAIWRDEEVRSMASKPLTPRAMEFAGHLLDSFFTPNGLHDEALSASEAARYFAERPWAEFNWEDALAMNLEKFDWNEASRIRAAYARDRRPGECCLSEPGCTLCPHNRSWRR